MARRIVSRAESDCQPLTECGPEMFEAVPRTSSTDRVCCPDDTFFSVQTSECLAIVPCDTTDEYQVMPATTTSNTVCYPYDELPTIVDVEGTLDVSADLSVLPGALGKAEAHYTFLSHHAKSGDPVVRLRAVGQDGLNARFELKEALSVSSLEKFVQGKVVENSVQLTDNAVTVGRLSGILELGIAVATLQAAAGSSGVEAVVVLVNVLDRREHCIARGQEPVSGPCRRNILITLVLADVSNCPGSSIRTATNGESVVEVWQQPSVINVPTWIEAALETNVKAQPNAFNEIVLSLAVAEDWYRFGYDLYPQPISLSAAVSCRFTILVRAGDAMTSGGVGHLYLPNAAAPGRSISLDYVIDDSQAYGGGATLGPVRAAALAENGFAFEIRPVAGERFTVTHLEGTQFVLRLELSWCRSGEFPTDDSEALVPMFTSVFFNDVDGPQPGSTSGPRSSRTVDGRCFRMQASSDALRSDLQFASFTVILLPEQPPISTVSEMTPFVSTSSTAPAVSTGDGSSEVETPLSSTSTDASTVGSSSTTSTSSSIASYSSVAASQTPPAAVTPDSSPIESTPLESSSTSTSESSSTSTSESTSKSSSTSSSTSESTSTSSSTSDSTSSSTSESTSTSSSSSTSESTSTSSSTSESTSTSSSSSTSESTSTSSSTSESTSTSSSTSESSSTSSSTSESSSSSTSESTSTSSSTSESSSSSTSESTSTSSSTSESSSSSTSESTSTSTTSTAAFTSTAAPASTEPFPTGSVPFSSFEQEETTYPFFTPFRRRREDAPDEQDAGAVFYPVGWSQLFVEVTQDTGSPTNDTLRRRAVDVLAEDPGPLTSIKDLVPPRFINCPSEVQRVFPPSNVASAAVFWDEPVAYDNVALNPVIASQRPGDVFSAKGSPHRVTYSVTDTSGLEAECEFLVAVEPVPVVAAVLATVAFEDLVQRSLAGAVTSPLLQTTTYQDFLISESVTSRFNFASVLDDTNTLQVQVRAPAGEQFGLQFRGQDVRARFSVSLEFLATGMLLPSASIPANASLVYASLAFENARTLDGQPVVFAADFFTPDDRRTSLGLDVNGRPTLVRLRGVTEYIAAGFVFDSMRVELHYAGVFDTVAVGGSGEPALEYELLASSVVQLESFFVEFAAPMKATQPGEDDDSSSSDVRGGYLTIVDFEPPSFNGTCPAGVSVPAARGSSVAVVQWIEPVPVDNRGILELRATLRPGATLAITPPGTPPHSVTYTAVDLFGQETECSFNVTVLDVEAPTVVCPANISVSTDPGVGVATLPTADLAPVVAADNGGPEGLRVATLPATYAIGTHELQLHVNDTSGNMGACAFAVTVLDTEAPAFVNCPLVGPSVVADDDATTASVVWDVVKALDNSGSVDVRASATPGDTFPTGVSTVAVTAQDGSGNSRVCAFNVTVSSTRTAAAASSKSDNTGLLAGLLAGAAVIAVLVVILVAMYRRNRAKPHNFTALMEEMQSVIQLHNSKNLDARGSTAGEYDNVGTEAGDGLAPRAPRELKRSQVRLLQRLGRGNFGDVCKGLVSEPQRPDYIVAVKTLHQGAAEEGRQELLRESLLMAQFQHENVVGLVGVVTIGDPLLVIIEFCELGCLKDYLSKRAGTVPEIALLGFARDCAAGLAYLAHRRFVHRDVAARNVLVSSDGRAKISDFGLSRDTEESEYYHSRGGALPVRWCAPESLEERRFSSASDCWAYGVLLYELWTDAAMPYKGWSNQKVWAKVTADYRLPCPPNCPPQVHAVMLTCWAADPEQRPPFVQLVEFFTTLAAEATGTATSPPSASDVTATATMAAPSRGSTPLSTSASSGTRSATNARAHEGSGKSTFYSLAVPKPGKGGNAAVPGETHDPAHVAHREAVRASAHAAAQEYEDAIRLLYESTTAQGAHTGGDEDSGGSSRSTSHATHVTQESDGAYLLPSPQRRHHAYEQVSDEKDLGPVLRARDASGRSLLSSSGASELRMLSSAGTLPARGSASSAATGAAAAHDSDGGTPYLTPSLRRNGSFTSYYDGSTRHIYTEVATPALTEGQEQPFYFDAKPVPPLRKQTSAPAAKHAPETSACGPSSQASTHIYSCADQSTERDAQYDNPVIVQPRFLHDSNARALHVVKGHARPSVDSSKSAFV